MCDAYWPPRRAIARASAMSSRVSEYEDGVRFLDAAGERRAIERLSASDTRLVFITNRATSEFGPAVFGRDYCQTLMRWIEENFEQCAVFGPDHSPDLEIGNRTFFIRAYRKKTTG